MTAITNDIDPDVDDEQLLVGAAVGEYVVEHQLGAGGFARVYQARHPVLGQRVAAKVLSRAVGQDAEAMRRFVREAQAASKIEHAGVVRVLGFGKLSDGRAFQLMELVDGPSLDKHLQAAGVLPLETALALLAGIAEALAAAHKLGIVHRDIKTSNVLLAKPKRTSPNGDELAWVPRLTDFGIAKALDGETDNKLTRTGSTLGTPAYMSPEQALGQAIGIASDVYSFGVMAFELLTGKVPFEGDSPFAVMVKHVQETPPLVSAALPARGVGFDEPIARMLSKQASSRPPSIEAAMATLQAASRQQVPTRPTAKRRVIALAVGVTAVVAAAGYWALQPNAKTPPLSAPTSGSASVSVDQRPTAAPPVRTDAASVPLVQPAPVDVPSVQPAPTAKTKPAALPKTPTPTVAKPATDNRDKDSYEDPYGSTAP